MAKRHHSSHHSGGHHMPKMREHGEHMGHEVYAGPHQRRALERMDAGMISEDHNAMANMPQDVKMMYYPKARYSTYDLDDTMRGIDQQQAADERHDVRRDAQRDGQY